VTVPRLRSLCSATVLFSEMETPALGIWELWQRPGTQKASASCGISAAVLLPLPWGPALPTTATAHSHLSSSSRANGPSVASHAGATNCSSACSFLPCTPDPGDPSCGHLRWPHSTALGAQTPAHLHFSPTSLLLPFLEHRGASMSDSREAAH
jgi:hypothetical protein